MEPKVFIRTLKMTRGRYTKKQNADAEKKTIEKMVENEGGKLSVIAMLNEAGETELKDYVKSVLGITSVVESKTAEVTPKVGRPKNAEKEYGRSSDGVLYEIDSIKKTCKKVYKDLKDLSIEDLEIPEMSLTTYQRYLKDRFSTETCTMKKGKLLFRGYRISVSVEDGFVVEDCRKKYEVVDTPWEGIPTPAELGDWFENPTKKEKSGEEKLQEYLAAVAEGKRREYEKKRERERKIAEAEKAEEALENIDFEEYRNKVLKQIKDIRNKTAGTFNPEDFATMIPFKRWKRNCKSLLTMWKNKKIRYAKFLKEHEEATIAETFVVEEKRHRSSFKGTPLPDHKKVGYLIGNKLEVDDKLVDAVPFLLDYLLYHEHRAMSQIMKYADGLITDRELIENPIEVDWKIEYHKRKLENTAHNARVLTCVFESCGIVAPQDLLYESDLVPGDVILLYERGAFHRKTVASTEMGVVLGKEIGLLKTDKWILAPKKTK